MNVNGNNAINANTNAVQNTSQNSAAANAQQTNENNVSTAPETPVAADVYEPSAAQKQTYKPDASRIKSMMAEHDQKLDSFRRLMEGLLTKQGETALNATGWDRMTNMKQMFEDGMMNVDAETRAKAQADIAEGGYYSVEETAKRILNFAVALSGGDPSKIETLEKAAMKGFEEAERMWGDKLPDISYRTMEAVKEGFAQWREAGSASAIALLND